MAAKSWSTPSVAEEPAQSSEEFVSLADVMSEQLAQKLTKDDDQLMSEHVVECAGGEELADWLVAQENDCDSDLKLAQLLQQEFDRQHDLNLKREENHWNRNSKVTLSYDLYRRHKSTEEDSDLEEEKEFEFGEQSRDWDSFERSNRTAVKVGAKGFTTANGKITTKHDLERSARKNAQKVMELESDLRTGDGGAIDMKLNNHVYNALRVHSISEGKRMARLHEKKEKSTAEKVLDEKSRILLFKLVNRGLLETINGVIATGKESVVLHGRGRIEKEGEEVREVEVAVKVFKTTLNEFKNRAKYIEKDPILAKSAKLSKQKANKMIPLWAEKEMHNLNRMQRNGILCPEVVILRKHVLVMTFVGKEGKAAKTLKEAPLTEQDLSSAYSQCTRLMARLYRECDLVHADLSEYNLLWHEKQIFVIDVSQSVFSTHPMAFKFLWRDCNNITKFFAKRCLPEVKSSSELFSKICGKSLDANEENEFNSVDLLDKMENYEKSEELLKYNDCENLDPFEDMLEKSLFERKTF